MRFYLIVALFSISAMAYGQVVLNMTEGTSVPNVKNIADTLSSALKNYESELDIIVEDEVLLRTVISQTGKKVIKITVVKGEFADHISWSKKQLWNLNLPEDFAGAHLDWVFIFGSSKPKAYAFEAFEKFPIVKVEEGLKTNTKFDKAIYRYSIDRELMEILEGYNNSANTDFEGLVDLNIFINETGKVEFIQPNLVSNDKQALKYVVESLNKIEFKSGAQINSKNVSLLHNESFEFIKKTTGNKDRYLNGLKHFKNKDYLSAAFEWVQIDDEVFKLDSTRYYQVAACCFLSGFSEYIEKANSYYKKAHLLDWEQFYIQNVSVSKDTNKLVDFAFAKHDEQGLNSPPLFKECENLESEKGKFDCFNRGLMKIVQTNFHYPEYLKQQRIQDKVWVSFDIEKNGSIDNIKILHGEYDGLNYETIRIVCLIPDVKPAYKNEEPIKMSYTMPINFRLR